MNSQKHKRSITLAPVVQKKVNNKKTATKEITTEEGKKEKDVVT